MDMQELLDREEIRALLAQYNVSGDRGRVDLLAATFAEDGVIEFSGERTQGPAAIAARLSTPGGKNPALSLVRHNLTTSQVTVDGDTAQGRTYFLVCTNSGADHQGVYIDRLKRTAQGWRFAHREVRIDWQAETSLFQPLHVRGQAPGSTKS
jgi:hypothetical protein